MLKYLKLLNQQFGYSVEPNKYCIIYEKLRILNEDHQTHEVTKFPKLSVIWGKTVYFPRELSYHAR